MVNAPLVAHIISGLGAGGAEAMLSKLVAVSSRYRHFVISLRDEGKHGAEIAGLGAEVRSLHLHRLGGLLTGAPWLIRLLKGTKPDVVQGWMNHGNLAATVGGILVGSPAPLVWNIRQSLGDLRFEKWSTRQIIKLNAKLSHLPSAILYNSVAGAREHEGLGFLAERRHVIPNGFDTDVFAPSPRRRAAARRRFEIEDDDIVIGLIARFQAWKNHGAFFAAASKVLREEPRARFLLAGSGTDWGNTGLVSLIEDPQVRSRTFLLGERTDIVDVTLALDIACNVSHGEGFPNAIGEAMACGVPCLVTAVSDNPEIVGDSGVICANTSAEAIAQGLLALVQRGEALRSELGARARERLKQRYSLPAVVTRYEDIYDQVRALPCAGSDIGTEAAKGVRPI